MPILIFSNIYCQLKFIAGFLQNTEFQKVLFSNKEIQLGITFVSGQNILWIPFFVCFFIYFEYPFLNLSVEIHRGVPAKYCILKSFVLNNEIQMEITIVSGQNILWILFCFCFVRISLSKPSFSKLLKSKRILS